MLYWIIGLIVLLNVAFIANRMLRHRDDDLIGQRDQTHREMDMLPK